MGESWWSKKNKLDVFNPIFYMLLFIGLLVLVAVTTGGVMILGGLWDLLAGLSKTIPIPVAVIGLIIVFIILSKKRNTNPFTGGG